MRDLRAMFLREDLEGYKHCALVLVATWAPGPVGKQASQCRAFCRVSWALEINCRTTLGTAWAEAPTAQVPPQHHAEDAQRSGMSEAACRPLRMTRSPWRYPALHKPALSAMVKGSRVGCVYSQHGGQQAHRIICMQNTTCEGTSKAQTAEKEAPWPCFPEPALLAMHAMVCTVRSPAIRHTAGSWSNCTP